MIADRTEASELDAWRFNGAGYFVRDALDQLHAALDTQYVINPQLRAIRAEMRAKYPDWDGTIQDAPNEYIDRSDMIREFWRAGDTIHFAATTAILMAAIHLEAMVNYCFYRRFGEAFTESVERLTLANRIEIAHRILGRPNFTGTAPHQALTALYDWRDRFAHGKNPGSKYKDLTRNHLRDVPSTITLPNALTDARSQLRRYLLAMGHIGTLNGYPGDEVLYDEWMVAQKLDEIDAYRFEPDQGTKVIVALEQGTS